jgi:hypothetical protein
MKKQKFLDDIKSLIELSDKMFNDILEDAAKSSKSIDKITLEKLAKKDRASFDTNYQKWYTESYAIINQILPDRIQEFKQFYLPDPKRKSYEGINFTIQDWLTGLRSKTNQFNNEKYFDDIGIVVMKFQTQRGILESCVKKFESSLFEIRQILQADLSDSEIQTASELKRAGFLRPAGVICGVVIEKHLQEVCKNHGVVLRKKDPTIGDLNDKLKQENIIDVPTWRKIQRLADIRNLCGHNKNREPKAEEIDEIIDETDKLIKSIF